MIELVNKKPVTASENEIKENPPSRTAKLRVARKISSWEN
jgi:16S rRNA (cytosine1402-N4)-methyltransferase